VAKGKEKSRRSLRRSSRLVREKKIDPGTNHISNPRLLPPIRKKEKSRLQRLPSYCPSACAPKKATMHPLGAEALRRLASYTGASEKKEKNNPDRFRCRCGGNWRKGEAGSSRPISFDEALDDEKGDAALRLLCRLGRRKKVHGAGFTLLLHRAVSAKGKQKKKRKRTDAGWFAWLGGECAGEEKSKSQ